MLASEACVLMNALTTYAGVLEPRLIMNQIFGRILEVTSGVNRSGREEDLKFLLYQQYLSTLRQAYVSDLLRIQRLVSRKHGTHGTVYFECWACACPSTMAGALWRQSHGNA